MNMVSLERPIRDEACNSEAPVLGQYYSELEASSGDWVVGATTFNLGRRAIIDPAELISAAEAELTDAQKADGATVLAVMAVRLCNKHHYGVEFESVCRVISAVDAERTTTEPIQAEEYNSWSQQGGLFVGHALPTAEIDELKAAQPENAGFKKDGKSLSTTWGEFWVKVGRPGHPVFYIPRQDMSPVLQEHETVKVGDRDIAFEDRSLRFGALPGDNVVVRD